MTKDEIITRVLLTTGTGSWGAYEWFEQISFWCRMVLPITGVISFVMVFIINWHRIKEAVRNARKPKG